MDPEETTAVRKLLYIQGVRVFVMALRRLLEDPPWISMTDPALSQKLTDWLEETKKLERSIRLTYEKLQREQGL